MHIIFDRRRFERLLPLVRDRGPAAYRAHFLRLEARNGELAISGLAVEAVIHAVVEEPGVLFIRAKLLRSLVEGSEGETVDCRVTEDAFMLGSVRLPMRRKSLVYFSDPAKAPRVLPGTERLKVRYGAVVEPRKNKGAKAGARARKGNDTAAMPLFDREITHGFELRPPSRAVTRRMEFAPAREAKAAPPPAPAPAAPAAREASGPLSIADFDRDQLKAALLAVVGTKWVERDDAIRLAARQLGFERCGSRVRKAFASAVNGLIRQGQIDYDRSLIRQKA